MTPFTIINLIECGPIIYSCDTTSGGIDLCTHADASFNTATGDFDLKTTDHSTFGDLAFTLEITASAFDAEKIVIFNLNFHNPCMDATI